MDTIGSRIRFARKRKKLTQAGLGELVGVESQAVSQWESGKRIPPTETLITVSRILDISTDFLLTGAKSIGHSDKPPTLTAMRGHVVPVVNAEHLGDLPNSIDKSEEFVASPWPADFALHIRDASNAGELNPGDISFWRISDKATPGKIVVALYGTQPTTIIGQYRQQATPTGVLTIIAPLNDAFPAARSDLDQIRIIATYAGSYRAAR